MAGQLHRACFVGRIERRIAGRGAVAARHQAGGAVVPAVVVEEGQRIDGIAAALGRQVAMQALVAGALQRLAAFHLRQEEALADQRTGRGQHRGQPAHRLYRGVQVHQRMPPPGPARHRPGMRGQDTGVEGGAERVQPVGRNGPAQQDIAITKECVAVDHGIPVGGVARCRSAPRRMPRRRLTRAPSHCRAPAPAPRVRRPRAWGGGCG